MDAATSTTTTSSNDPTNPRAGQRRSRGGRSGRGAAAAAESRRGDNQRGRGRGRPSRGRMEQDVRNDPAHYDEAARQNTISLDQLSLNPSVSTANGQSGQEGPDEAEEEGEVCFICASPVVHHSVAPCNHLTCHICALRLRALYKTNTCAHCRTPANFVIFTDQPEKRFEQFADSEFSRSDDNLGIKYEKNEIFEDTVLLLRYNCPDPSCDVACYGWPDLHRHVKNVHSKVMCDLCTRNKKVFTHEHELFTPNSLRKHERYGDDNPGAVDQSGFRGHPECGFCRERFYGDDELYAHCRDRHERCHICDRRDAAAGTTKHQQQYYIDYNALELHFSKDHFMCPDRECLEKKFVVFENEMDLKGHQLETHPNGLTKDARRDARRVDMSGFDFRSSRPQEQRGGGRRENRGRGRGRDPNVDAGPLPTSTAQPMRRDELAFQRQMAIHSAQSVSNRTFGGQLTSHDAVAARPPPNTREPETISAPRGGPATRPDPSANGIGASTPSQTDILDVQSSTAQSLPPAHLQTPADRARALRHASIIERATNLLGNDGAKMSTFRSRISAYKNGTSTATELINSFFALFECPTHELGTLIKELAELFEVSGKREGLVQAWNDWRAINEDYPSLPGGTSSSSTGATASGKRILKLKSSTAQSSRSAVSRHGSWGTASGPAPSRAAASAFPGLPPVAGSSSSSRAAATSATPWLKPSITAAPAAGSNQSSTRPSPNPSRAASRAAPAGADAFPALPASQKPGMNVSRPGYAGNPFRRDGNSGASTPVNAWSGGATTPLDDEDAGMPGGKKGKGKKKQTLIHWG